MPGWETAEDWAEELKALGSRFGARQRRDGQEEQAQAQASLLVQVEGFLPPGKEVGRFVAAAPQGLQHVIGHGLQLDATQGHDPPGFQGYAVGFDRPLVESQRIAALVARLDV
jgi:hypothetical protein